MDRSWGKGLRGAESQQLRGGGMKVERNSGGSGTEWRGAKLLTADNRDPGKWHGNDILHRGNGYGSK